MVYRHMKMYLYATIYIKNINYQHKYLFITFLCHMHFLLGSEVDKPSKILIKTFNIAEYIKLM